MIISKNVKSVIEKEFITINFITPQLLRNVYVKSAKMDFRRRTKINIKKIKKKKIIIIIIDVANVKTKTFTKIYIIIVLTVRRIFVNYAKIPIVLPMIILKKMKRIKNVLKIMKCLNFFVFNVR